MFEKTRKEKINVKNNYNFLFIKTIYNLLYVKIKQD